jgi:SAM-dependent methyltransferase
MSDNLSEVISGLKGQPVMLHLGCGGIKLKGYINIDKYPHDPAVSDSSRSGCEADIFADIRCLGLLPKTVDEIYCSHVLDHFVRWEAVDMLRDWHRALKDGGKLIMEMADFTRCVLWLFHPLRSRRKLALSQFYGNQWDRIDYETHRYVWGSREIRRLLSDELGFSDVSVSHRTQTHYPGRDMRIVATR